MAKGSDGMFVFAVLVLAAAAALFSGLGGLGSEAYASFAPLMLIAAGGVSYFIVKSADGFGIAKAGSAVAYAGLALAVALLYSSLLLGSTGAIFGSVAAAVAIACAAPLVALAVRERAPKENRGGIGGAAAVAGIADAGGEGQGALSASASI